MRVSGILVLFTLFCLVALARTTQRPSDEQMEEIPHPTDKAAKRALHCNSCHVLARETFLKLSALTKLRHGKPKHYELVDAVDALCREIGQAYGLLLKNNKPTMEFSKDARITRYTGSWITTFLERRCGEIMEAFDDELLVEATRAVDEVQFRRTVCTVWEKSCAEDEGSAGDL